MHIVTRYMGLIFYWFSVKDLGGFSEAAVQSTLEDVKQEYSSLPRPYHQLVGKWVEALDKLAKANVDMPFPTTGSMFITTALEKELYPDVSGDLQVVLSELDSLVSLNATETAQRLMIGAL
jgi:hypothetical protein